MKLTEEQKKWLSALESGEYSQGTAALCTVEPKGGPGRFYCCLGVAEMSLGTETAGPEEMCGRQVLSFLERRDGHVQESVRTALLSSSWRKLGLKSPIGDLDLDHKDAFDAVVLRHEQDVTPKALSMVACLTSYNDKARVSFKAIAAAIREVPEAVFDLC